MLKVGIVGVTGYTGMELVRLLLGHPGVELSYASSRSAAGQRLREALSHLGPASDLVISGFNAEDAVGKAAFFFACLPHGESMEAVALLRQAGSKVVDLSADFRLGDASLYEEWYGPHTRRDLLPEAVYGMPEIHRDEVLDAGLVANPGCYPTSVILGLAPLLATHTIHTENIVVDSKSGVSGAGREPKPGSHFPETFGNCSAYNVAGKHRHIGEMEQELGRLAAREVRITFTPHLLPVSRGILSTIYARPSVPMDGKTLHRLFEEYYSGEPFMQIRGPGEPLPALKDVRGTNFSCIGPRYDERTGTVVIVSCLDNLVKGASGQAVQNMNIMTGFPETEGLTQTAMHP